MPCSRAWCDIEVLIQTYIFGITTQTQSFKLTTTQLLNKSWFRRIESPASQMFLLRKITLETTSQMKKDVWNHRSQYDLKHISSNSLCSCLICVFPPFRRNIWDKGDTVIKRNWEPNLKHFSCNLPKPNNLIYAVHVHFIACTLVSFSFSSGILGETSETNVIVQSNINHLNIVLLLNSF